jgi:hypothetical protein
MDLLAAPNDVCEVHETLVLALATRDDVHLAIDGEESIGPSSTLDPILTSPPDREVGAPTGPDDVLPVTTVQVVASATPAQHVLVRATDEHVVGGRPLLRTDVRWR